MGVILVTGEGEINIDFDNFGEAMQRLENMLDPGTPVMFQTSSSSDFMKGGSSESLLFISGGKLSLDGFFNLQKGKRNFSYGSIDENGQNRFKLINNGGQTLNNCNLTASRNWLVDSCGKEDLFSGFGDRSFFDNIKTNKIVIGDILNEQFPEEMRVLKFGRDSVYFNLHSAYSMQNSLVSSEERERLSDNEKYLIDKEDSKKMCLRACMNLINEAERQIGDYTNLVSARKVNLFVDKVQDLRMRGYPISEEDYFISQLSHPKNGIGFVKTGVGMQYGETYILPFSDKMDSVVEFAFSDENVGKFYPYGLN